MTQITRPSDILPQTNVQVSESLASQAGAGTAAVGQELSRAGRASQETRVGALSAQVGELVTAEGRRYFEQSKKAHQTGLLSNSLSQATLEFQKSQQERLSRATDDNGNPTFTTLTEDVGQIGKDVMDSVSSKILDPEVLSRFRNDFGTYVSNQQILSLKKARTQQMDFSRTSLDTGLGTLLRQGISDDLDNMASYEGQARQLLDDSLESGVISSKTHANMSNDFSAAIREGSLDNVISNDPGRASGVLQNSSDTLGIKEEVKTRLDKTLNAKVTSDKIQVEKSLEIVRRDAEDRQATLAEEIERQIDADAIREDELLRQEDRLDSNSFIKLKKRFIKAASARRKRDKSLNEISKTISSGESTIDFTPRLIDNHYKRLIESQEKLTGQQLKLSGKAEVANVYGNKVKAFAKEANSSILSGDTEAALEAVSAYTYTRDRNGKALEGNTFTTKAQNIAEYTEHLIERASLDPQAALLKARDSVLKSNEGAVEKDRRKEFNKNKEFKGEDLIEITADSLGAENIFGINKEITNDTADTFKGLVEQAFLSTGDIDASKKIAATQMDRTHGISSINGEDIYMFAPPEELFPGVDVEDMRQQIQEDLTNISLPERTDKSTVKIISDVLTRGTFVNGKEVISYGLTHDVTDEDGNIETFPLLNEDGTLRRWVPDIEIIVEERRRTSISEAAAEDIKIRDTE